ncbi:ATP-binding protein, partial [bacterium]|nr:ATP-binding protein [bacterium]
FNESIIQSMEAGLLTTDLEGRITSLNAGGEKILGWKARTVVGKQIKSVLKSEEVDFLLSKPNSPGTLPYSRETELTVKTGKKIAIGFTTTNRINNQRRKVGTIISFRDISQLKQMQSEVIRMDRLASLGVLASGIAHEIKNPLAGIKTMAQACNEEFEETDSRREYLTRIVRQVNRLDDLLKTFFEYARPRSPDRKPHKLSEILREVINLVSKKLVTSGITYYENFSSNIPELMIDSQQFQQVFLNLILNAIEAMPAGGTLTISVKSITISKHGIIQGNNKDKNKMKNGSFVEIVVSDTGVGIDPDKLETIFDPFFTTKPNGTGLGLSIVYRITEEHQGDIHVESHIGQGTSFTITLPTGA